MPREKKIVRSVKKIKAKLPRLAKKKHFKTGKSSLFLNRELSWLEFNYRVLQLSQDTSQPILERLKFSCIFSSNLDEYFMIRARGLQQDCKVGTEYPDPSGKAPKQILNEVNNKVQELITKQYDCFTKEILPALEKSKIYILNFDELSKGKKKQLSHYFENQIFPLLTPFAVDAGHPFPFLGNLKLNLIVLFKDQMKTKKNKSYAFVEVPSTIPRLVPIKFTNKKGHYFILLEELVRKHVHRLFPDMEIDEIASLRVTRNQDYTLHEEVVLDLANSVQSELRDHAKQVIVRIEIDNNAPKKILDLLSSNFETEAMFIYKIKGPINICDFSSIQDLPVDPSLKDPPFNPRVPAIFAENKDIFSVIRQGDALLHHPYDSFAVVLSLINAAADDPNTLAIKQTLYRIGEHSPIVSALRRAAENGKQVTAVIELKARFDEKHNIDWALQMRESGVHTVFGFVNWKTHCKATLIIRREGRQLRRYVHLSTGNYNAVTAKIYTDLGLLSCNPAFGNDVSSLFNVLTGFNSWFRGEKFPKKKITSMFHQFFISPVTMHKSIMHLIEREAASSTRKNPGHIIAKMNALEDEAIIAQLYVASQAGVKIDLLVRGICCLRPGIPGISENIRVISIVDRFLEHSRIFYFKNNDNPEIYSGSADWMQRSFSSRVEILYPILNQELKSRILNQILSTYLSDNQNAWIMQADGSYQRGKCKPGQKALRSQLKLISLARSSGIKSPPYEEEWRKMTER